MSAPVDRGLEADGFVVNDLENSGGSKAGFFSGDGDPWVIVPDAPQGSVYAKTDGTVYILNGASGATPTDWGLTSTPVVWRNLWAAGTYEKNEMVRDGDWTMIANLQTTDRAAPQTEGEPAFSLPDAPSWATASETTLRITGARFTVTDEILLIEAIRIWTENIDADTDYFFQLVDVTDSANEKVLADGAIDNSVQGWVEVDIGSLLVGNGQTLDLRSFQLKQTPASEFTHSWDAVIPDDVGVDPGTGNWSRDSFFSVIRISDNDSGVTDRSADLATLGVGDMLEINETGSTRRVEHYTINSATDQGTYFEFGVDLDYVDQSIRDGRGCDIHGINIGAPSNVDIPSLANHWLNVADVDGFDVTDVTTIAANLDDNAYGVDMKFAEFVASPDWDLVAYSGSLQLSGGGTGGGVTVEDEGTPLATVADTLNFVGAGVTAAGSGTTKTITIPGGGTPSDQPSVQARRNTAQAFTTVWADVDLQLTDEENDPSVVEHNATVDRIDLKETGLYWIASRVDTDQPSFGTNWQTVVQSRVRVNDATVLDGSLTEEQALEDSSLVGDAAVWPSLKAGFLYSATAGDFITLQIQRTDSDGGTNIQAAANRTTLIAIRLTGQTGPQGAPGGGGSTMRIPHTWAIAGEIKVPVGQTDFIVPFFVSLAAGQTAKLVKARHQIQAGTSVTADLEINAVGATGFTGISITTTPTDTDPADIVLSNNDELALVVSAVAGTPQNMSFTVFIEVTG